MSTDSPPINLTHHFLIAMPGLNDENFNRSVVYLCEHSDRGALGLVINKPSDLDMQQLFKKVDLNLSRSDLAHLPVLQGGPVHTERGFVLHESMRAQETTSQQSLDNAENTPVSAPVTEPKTESMDFAQGVYASTLAIPGGLEMTTSRDVLEALSNGAGPRKVLISLGYSAWGQGQLESEIAENSWLTVGADPQIIFDTPIDQRYERALSLLGLQAWMLSPDAGHA
jgi:putative transcriptional regulator